MPGKLGKGAFDMDYYEEQSEGGPSFDPSSNVSKSANSNAKRLIQSPMLQSSKDFFDTCDHMQSPLERFVKDILHYMMYYYKPDTNSINSTGSRG